MWHKFESEVNWSAFGSFDGSFFLPPRNIVMSWVLAGKGPRTYARLLTMACPVVVWGVVETLAVDPIVVEMGRCLSFMIVVEFVFQVILPYTAAGLVRRRKDQCESVRHCWIRGFLLGVQEGEFASLLKLFVETLLNLLKLCWNFVEYLLKLFQHSTNFQQLLKSNFGGTPVRFHKSWLRGLATLNNSAGLGFPHVPG